MVSDWVSNFGLASVSNPKATAFGSNKVKDILEQEGCVGIRIFNGFYDSNRRLVIIGIDENGDDMMSGNILEFSNLCPPNCAPTTAIN
ncbi:MAG: hypothetical protein JPMHGGIA_02445 [Saprospiraceae bacterium]|jgi:hypothetical protein|nr:hypothetical protein [Saprospiraceae bacterium]